MCRIQRGGEALQGVHVVGPSHLLHQELHLNLKIERDREISVYKTSHSTCGSGKCTASSLPAAAAAAAAAAFPQQNDSPLTES